MRKVLVIGIIVLFLGMSIVSSTELKMDHYIDISNLPVAVDKLEQLLACNHLAYLGADEILYELILNEPGNLTELCGWGGYPVASSGVWMPDQILLVVAYSGGFLFEIDIENCDITEIGGGSGGVNGLTYDPVDNTLYGCKSDDLYKIDPETGEQEYIGAFGTDQTHIEIACDSDGNMYTWDVKFSGDSYLYKVDKETGQATVVGSLGMTLTYAQSGAFCKKDDILYLAAYVSSPLQGCYLFECDKETADCTLLGKLAVNGINFLVFPDKNLLPIADFNWTPTLPHPGETILFNASDSYDPDGYIKLYEWDWDNDGVYDYKNYTSPIATHIFEEEGKYLVTLRVRDHNFSNAKKTKRVRVEYQPPTKPIIDGPTSGKVGVEYTYTFNSTDRDGEYCVCYVDWGDGSTEIVYPTWYNPEESGPGIANHSWDKKGNYVISAIAEDENGLLSGTGTLKVKMPRDKATSNSLLLWFLEQFPLLERLLNIIK